MSPIRVNRSHFFGPLALGLFLFTFVSSCSHNQNDHPVPEKSNQSAQLSPRPEVDQGKAKNTITEPITESDPALVPDEAWILSPTLNVVNLTRKGTNTPVAIQGNVGFKLGDLLEVGNASAATAQCKHRMCVLGSGNYNSCCTVPCQQEISMMRRTATPDSPIINRTDLSTEDAAALSKSEKQLRELNLKPVTTQYLITTLYTNWKIKEANQEMDRLSNQLATPAAKEELQTLYGPVITKTADMHLKYNRVEDAKKLYLLNLSRSSAADDPRYKAAAHVGLAQAQELSGNKTEAISNFESAREIYVKQGDRNAADSTEKQIEKTRNLRGVDSIKTTRPLLQKSP